MLVCAAWHQESTESLPSEQKSQATQTLSCGFQVRVTTIRFPRRQYLLGIQPTGNVRCRNRHGRLAQLTRVMRFGGGDGMKVDHAKVRVCVCWASCHTAKGNHQRQDAVVEMLILGIGCGVRSMMCAARPMYMMCELCYEEWR